ncbi:MAG: protein kinase domain-containing protein [Planctomycetota bacterium]|jgi:serine/threonine protein kinase/Tfp pilus assembly protein PilF
MATKNDNQEHNSKEAVRQFFDALLRGNEPDVEELISKYPELEHQIRQKIEKFQKVDSLFDAIVQADESDFTDTATGHDLAGQKVGNFEIVKIIGRGGMGVVYLARDTKLKRSVAIKSMPVEMLADSTTRLRFRREAELLASLNHPNIAVIHEIIEQEEGANYLVLEYVPGQTLAQRIAHKPLKLEEALSIAQQVAEAVSAAHDKGVIHRDLKPGNIKITPDGRVKVLDFGLAKASVSKDRSDEKAVTQPGCVIGTPAYMSPEQARGKDTDHRTDIWSFGCIMYEMLTGHLPFEGETATDTLARIIERKPDWDFLPQSTPMNIRVLLRRCFEKNPQQRIGDITNAALEIRETLSASAMAVPTKSRKVAMIIGVVIIIVLSAIAVRFIPEKQAQLSPKEIRLVVLPFENLGPVEDEYFADGISEEIMSRLSTIHTLGVISRTSAIQYKSSNKAIQEIGEELGVEYVLEGTVRWERPPEGPSRVRVTPQLIRVSDDTHLWSERYDAVLADIFQVQSDIAEQVAQALDITLLEPERQALKTRPTENMEAYEYYLRGNDYFYRGYLANDFRIAIQMYEKAVELDPIFALAYTDLSKVHAKTYWFYYDRSEERIVMAKQAVDEAIRLNPELPEAHIALGFYYYRCHLDYDHALEEFAIARKSQPNNSDLLKGIGVVQRRQGKLKQALANFSKVSELTPLSNVAAYEVGYTFMLLRKYQEAESYYERAILLRPDSPTSYSRKARLYLFWEGSTEKARAVVERALQNITSPEAFSIVNLLITLDVYDGNYQQGLDRLSLRTEDIDDQYDFIPNSLRYAQICGYMKKKELAKKYYEDARSILDAKIQERHEDARFHSALGIAYAGLGREEDAIREGKLAVELLPVSKEALRGAHRIEDLARIYVMVGEFDAAIDQLEFLLSKPGEMSIPLLRLAPAWDPLRNHPDFIELLESGK